MAAAGGGREMKFGIRKDFDVVSGESCEECVFHNGSYCTIHGSDRDCSDFTDQFGGYVFKVVAANGKGGAA